MKIEEEIKQQSLSNEYYKLGINILYTGSWINLKQLNILKKFGISPQQYNVLKILKSQSPKPSTINLLIEGMIDKSSNASRLVEKLRIKGFVERDICPTNRRSVDIFITEKGLKLLEEIDKLKMFETTLKSLSVREASNLNKLLDKLRD